MIISENLQRRSTLNNFILSFLKNKMKDLLVDGDSDHDIKFTINEDYASKYSTWREKEFYRKLKDRVEGHGHGDGNEPSSSEDDEDAKDLKKYEKDFFTTLSFLKKKDPRIYNENIHFFPSSSREDDKINIQSHSKVKKDKPFVLRDYERQIILEKEGKLSGDDEIAEENGRSYSPTYVEEQKALKDSFKHVLEHSDSEGENDFGNLFKKKKKTVAEMKKEEEDYIEWLKGRKNELKDKRTESDLKGLRDFWNDPNLNSDELYLRDYILNKRFLDPENNEFQPEYNEIIRDDCELDRDNADINKMEEFEHKYNFRFEEPDSEFIKRYPRSVETSFRRKDDRRKRKREELRARKEAEMTAKREEIKQLKALKRKEILAKIEKIKKITGNDDIDFLDEDLEEDFSPEQHDRKMNQLFNDDYYRVEETEKPDFLDLDRELDIEDWENWPGKNDENEQYNGYHGQSSWEVPHCEDPNFNMDCDYDPKADLQEELISKSKSRKRQGRISKFKRAISKQKPIFDPSNKTFEEYFDEYYQLDCEDIIDDLPCRFKYRKTTPNNYGLTVDEILRADPKELNAWCSLKKVVKYKPEHVEEYEVKVYQQKGKSEALKRKILPSLYESVPDDNLPEYENARNESSENKKKKKKKKHYNDGQDLNFDLKNDDEFGNADLSSEKKKKKKKKKHDNDGQELNFDLKNDDEYENADLSSEKKKKKKKKKHDKDGQELNFDLKNVSYNDDEYGNADLSSEKKKKKKKEKSTEQENFVLNNASEDNVQEKTNATSGTENKTKKKKKKKKEKEQNSSMESERRVAETSEEVSEVNQTTNKKLKKRKFQERENNEVQSSEIRKKQKLDNSNNSVFNSNPKKLLKRKEKLCHSDKRNNNNKESRGHVPETEIPISDTRLKAYGIHPKKFKNKIRYGNKPNLWQ